MHIENGIATAPPVAHHPLLKLVAYTSTASIIAFLLALNLGGPPQLVIAIFGLASVTTLPLIGRAAMLLSRIDGKDHPYLPLIIKANFLLHLAPAGYLILYFFTPPTLPINAMFVLPLALFFYTGRRTWQAMHEQFGGKLYKIFVKGNTIFIFNLPLFLLLGLTFKESLGTQAFKGLVVGYFAGHLLFTGYTVLKMEREFGACPGKSS